MHHDDLGPSGTASGFRPSRSNSPVKATAATQSWGGPWKRCLDVGMMVGRFNQGLVKEWMFERILSMDVWLVEFTFD